MGAYSTLNITRTKARKIMLERLMDDVTDSQLERFMDEYLESSLRNCRIVSDGDEYSNDDEV